MGASALLRGNLNLMWMIRNRNPLVFMIIVVIVPQNNGMKKNPEKTKKGPKLSLKISRTKGY